MKDEEKNVDKAGRHCVGLSMGFPVRQAGRHHLAIQKESGRMAEKERVPEDLTSISPLAGFKSVAHLSVYNTDNEEVKNE